jgi:hypothetical protein
MTFLLIVTLSSMLLAVVMSVIAWRLAAAERRRSEARVAALAEKIHAPSAAALAASSQQRSQMRGVEVGLRGEPPRLAAVRPPRPAPRWDDDLPLRAEPVRPAAELFAAPQGGTSGRRLAFVALTVAVAAGVLLGVTLLGGGGSPAEPFGAVQPATGDNRVSASAQPAPLELVALGHERDGDRLTVRGVVRHASGDAPLDSLTAVVFAFNADGGFVTSARATVDAGEVRAAGETAFVVTVPDAGSARRYRVSFRSGDRIVPHLDRREPIKRP